MNARRVVPIFAGFACIPLLMAAENPAPDPNYLALRGAAVNGVYRVANLVMKRDAGTFTFQSGAFSLSPAVLGKRTFAVFTGDGTFHLTPATPGEASHLKVVTGAPELDEVFHTAIFCFTDQTADEILAAAKPADESPAAAVPVFRDFRSMVRRRSDQPRDMIEALLGGEDAVNVDAELLRDLYTPGRTSFAAYIHGQKHSDLRFIVNPAGAIPQLPSPEEVALISAEPETEHEGILYLSHLQTELAKGTASSLENNRWAQAESYQIDTAIAGNDHLTATAAIKMKIVAEGARVVKFGLLPALRVTSVKMAGQEIPFIQEPRNADGSFYMIFPAAMKSGTEAEVGIAYSGDKVVSKQGGGTFAVGARTAWYPSLNSFTDRAKYDLTFHVPKRYVLVSVGTLEKSSTDKDDAITHWVSDIPLAVAGFNYGDFKKTVNKDDVTGTQIEVYSTHEVPDYLAATHVLLDPTSMAKNAGIDAQNAVRVFDSWFGKFPYSRIAITEQPQFSFGQSWPSLVYLPISAFLDPTQRFNLLGGASAFRMAEFIDEVTPHEVSHQWWGHEVGWASYHDQWLSEGFADFSAGLFLAAANRGDDEQKYWESQRHRIIDKNEFGMSANDAGPLWLGSRLDIRKNSSAYDRLTYSKGAYILQMLKAMMHDAKTKDAAFMEMMHDFAATFAGKNASTEAFAALVTKHMLPGMDLGGDKTMKWFFDQWVYGTEVPHYAFEYTLTPGSNGQTVLTGHLTQAGVSDSFRVAMPLYVELASKQMVPIALVPVVGNNTKSFSFPLPFKPNRVAVNAFHDVLATDTSNHQGQ